MRYCLSILLIFFLQLGLAQLTCESISEMGITYKLNGHKNGRGRLFNTDSAITSKMQYASFEMKLVSNLTADEKSELVKYKIDLNPSDTVIFYDWDIMHQGKMGYHGKAVAKVKINCTDSMISMQKYLLRAGTTNYVPNRFKIIRMNEKDFILSDRNHPYLNINVYFKKE